MESKDRNEKVLDALIKIASEEAMLNELDSIPSCEELDKLYSPSPQFEKRMGKIISGNRSPKQLRTAFKISGRIATGFAVLFTETWDDLSEDGSVLSWDTTYYVSKGYTYRLTVTATVYRNGISKTVLSSWAVVRLRNFFLGY